MYLRKIRRIAYLLFISALSILITIFLLVSPIAELIIESNSVAWTGRRIRMDDLRINLLNGVVRFENLYVYEQNSNEAFFFAGILSVNSDLFSFLTGDNRIREIRLVDPVITLKQDGMRFNFDDLITRFNGSEAEPDTAASARVNYLLQHTILSNGTINYICSSPAVDAGILKLNLDCGPVSTKDPMIHIKTDFLLKSGGKAATELRYNTKTGEYNAIIGVDKLDLKLFYPYLSDYILVESLHGMFSTSLKLKGNSDRPADISASGEVAFRDVKVTDTTSEQLASVGTFKIGIDTLNSGGDFYFFNNILIDNPFINFTLFSDRNNFGRLMTDPPTFDTLSADTPEATDVNIFRMMADYIVYFISEYKVSNYKANSFQLNNGSVRFTDYTLEDKFVYHLDSIRLSSENLNSADDRLAVGLNARMNQSGILSGNLSVNPEGFSDIEMNLSLKQLMLSDINPYSVYYIASPFIQGQLSFESSTTVSNLQLKSENTLRIEQIRVGEKVKSTTAVDLPVKLAVAMLRDLHGNIGLSVPVEGDLNDPTYRWGKALIQVLKNLVVKAAVAPYRLLAGMFGGDEEQYKTIRMKFVHPGIPAGEISHLENLVKVLEAKPELSIGLIQQSDPEYEAELLGLFRAKLGFLGLGSGDSLRPADLERMNAISGKDSLFTIWLDNKTGRPGNLLSAQQKVILIYGRDLLLNDAEKQERLRAAEIERFFVSRGIDKSRIIIQNEAIRDPRAAQSGPLFNLTYLLTKENEGLRTDGQGPVN